MNLFKNPIFIIFLLVFAFFLLLDYIENRKFFSNVYQGKFPQSLIDFPDIKASPKTYLETKEKINEFVESILSNLQENSTLELKLNELELNNLHVKGVSVNKYSEGTHVYYKIENSYILEKKINFPSPFSIGLNKYSFKEKSMLFFKKEDLIWEKYKFLSEPRQKEESITIAFSPLIRFIFGVGKYPYGYFPEDKSQDTIEYQKFLNIVNEIKDVEIREGNLIFISK